MSKIRFYIDENITTEVAKQLRQKGIEAVSVLDLQRLGDKDLNHIQHAFQEGYAICTYDQDFLIMNAQGVEHAGIIYAQRNSGSIGGWVRELSKIHLEMSAEEMVGQVKFVNVK